jgi:hypothetical protein
MVSTRDLSLLPDIDRFKSLTQSLAMLDAILADDWEGRYYSFNASWKQDKAMASMRNGSGDEFYAMFMPFGVILKGFAHESTMSPYRVTPPKVWRGVLDSVPPEFTEFLSEPAFSPLDTTFCIWHMQGDTSWQCGNIEYPAEKDPDGSEDLLALLAGKPHAYQSWAEEYYGKPVRITSIEKIYGHQPLTEELVAEFNSKMPFQELVKEAEEIGYP